MKQIKDGNKEDNRSKWDSPIQGRRNSPRRAERDGRNDRRRNDYRDNDRRSTLNKNDDRYRQRNERTRYERDKSADRGKNSRNDSQRTRDNRRDEYIERHKQKRERSYSRSPRRDIRQQQRKNRRSHSQDKDTSSYQWGKKNEDERKQYHDSKPKDKEEPNFGLSGALTEDTNKVNGVVVKYAEPPEARRPKRRWRLYPFKGETALPVLHIHRQSCFLVGRDRKVVDLAVDHPSCSKQHAALQYRLVSFKRDDGTQGKRVRLYIIDLDSANGTFLNNKQIEPRKYYELLEKDVIKFGFSTREYVLLHENSKEDQEDDDISIKQETGTE